MIDAEMQAIIEDGSKQIHGDIAWAEDEDHSHALEFRTDVDSSPGYPLVVKGRVNQKARTLTFCLIHRGAGPIYRLDLGKDHHNPTCQYVGDKHKHVWTERTRDKEAYVPGDITEPVTNPLGVWRQFCEEARIVHLGSLHEPPPRQLELFP